MYVYVCVCVRQIKDEYTVVLTLTDHKLGDGQFITQSMLLLIEDINDNEPIFRPYESSVLVKENAPPRVLTTLLATDQDEGPFGQVRVLMMIMIMIVMMMMIMNTPSSTIITGVEIRKHDASNSNRNSNKKLFTTVFISSLPVSAVVKDSVSRVLTFPTFLRSHPLTGQPAK